MKIERGVMAIKDGMAWGIAYKDGQIIAYGWIDPEDAQISDPEYCKKPTDLTYPGSYDEKELSTAKLVFVERRTEFVILNELGK